MDNIKQLNHTIIEFYDKLSSWEHSVVRDSEFSLPQTHIVEVLGAHNSLTMKELASKIGITMGSLTVQINKMVELGLVSRQPHQNDGRSILVNLTDKGETLYQEHDQLHLTLTQDITAALTDAERQNLLQYLLKINNAF